MASSDAKQMTVRLYKVPTPDDEHALTIMDASDMVLAQSNEIERLRAACDASWALGHKVYHQAATSDAPDWVTTRKLLAEALGKTL